MLQELKNSLSSLPEYRNKKFLLTVSGGIDSMVLLYAFKELTLKFGVAHCNFQLREEASDLDEKLVETQSKPYPFHIKKFDVAKYQKENGGSTQMAARDIRYSWFNELISKHNYDYIITAHHLNDQIETFFINLTRGTGLDGLIGMKKLNGNIFRPMLNISRTEIEDYANINYIKYRDDESNTSTKYKRNKIRHKLIPILKELNPSFENTMLNNLKILDSTNKIYTKTVESKLSQGIIKTQAEGFYINIKELLKLPQPNQYLFEYVRRFNFNAIQTETVFQLIPNKKSTGKIFLSTTHKLVIDREHIIISPIKKEQNETIEIKNFTKNVTFPINLTFNTKPSSETKINTDPNFAFLDQEKITLPVFIRKWQKGDYFYPLGMTGKKKLSDFFTDQKLSLIEKESIYVITSNNKIVWIVGHRINDKYKITSKTKRVLVLTLN